MVVSQSLISSCSFVEGSVVPVGPCPEPLAHSCRLAMSTSDACGAEGGLSLISVAQICHIGTGP